jgi:SAM-dependent methyltransferase
MGKTRYDDIARWYEGWRPAVTPDELDALRRLLGPGSGRCLDIGCGNGVSTAVVAELGWTAVGVDVSTELLELARGRGLAVQEGAAEALPFEDATFDAAVSVWTHTDIEDFSAALREAARVLRPGAPFVYVGGHPCFVGPHSLFVGAEGVPELHPGYRPARRYDDSAPGVANPDGVRRRVGGMHLPLDDFLDAFTDAPLRLERFEELGEGRDYPYLVALRARR